MSEVEREWTTVFIERLTEDESLTDRLDDSAAALLLAWGVRQIQKSPVAPTTAGMELRLRRIRRTMRMVNRLNAARRSLSDGEFVASVLDLLQEAGGKIKDTPARPPAEE